MTIAMTGATGNLGQLIAKALIRAGHAPRTIASVRRPEKADSLSMAGIQVRHGDYDAPDTLAASFRDASKLLLVSSPERDDDVRLRQHRAAIRAAAHAGVRHIVYTSVAYPEKGKLPLHRLHLATEQAIRESGLSYTILRNAGYLDIVRFLGVREAALSGILLSPPGDWTFNNAAREDLALAAAAVLTEEGHEGRTYELTAARAWRLDDLARAIAKVTGRRVAHRADPDMHGDIYRLLPLSESRLVSPDLARLAGGPLWTMQDEVRRMFGETARSS
ncbi:NmrA family NAD(P)-binding protein [Cohnella nanjingensis]|uniref:NAD(P)H-binding protein n=1 Tax=Cohnella nanjingensis TaxID=1387779 RepID=A0A7X0RMT8_9BACL|nr:NAD(P)H-binding protein [Cohnella nanjingensis]MBB6670437.1 NAD(P)H-binding protein [Cohnella nanjingensis]